MKGDIKMSKTFIIPEGTTVITQGIVPQDVTKVIIPDGVAEIGEYAFSRCKALVSITIPNGVVKIGHGAFIACDALEAITIPDGVAEIGGAAFYGCKALKAITIPEGVTRICDWLFFECNALTWSCGNRRECVLSLHRT